MACLEAQDREGRLSCWYFRYWAGWLVGHELGMPAPFLVRFTHTMGCQAGHPSNRRCSISARSCLSPPFRHRTSLLVVCCKYEHHLIELAGVKFLHQTGCLASQYFDRRVVRG